MLCCVLFAACLRKLVCETCTTGCGFGGLIQNVEAAHVVTWCVYCLYHVLVLIVDLILSCSYAFLYIALLLSTIEVFQAIM